MKLGNIYDIIFAMLEGKIEDKIYKDYIEAFKAKDKHKLEFLSFIRSELKNQAINLKKEKLEDQEALAVLKKQQRRLLEAKKDISQSQRADLIENLEKEIALIGRYLPPPLSDQEIGQIIDEVISQTNASSLKDMGKVMKEVLAKVGVRADSKKVSSLVKEKLSSLP